jgi:hypothetical protein
MISRTWRIATLSAGIIAPLDCQRRDPKQASGGARRHSRPRAALFRSGGRHHLVMVGGLDRNQHIRTMRLMQIKLNCVGIAIFYWLILIVKSSLRKSSN